MPETCCVLDRRLEAITASAAAPVTTSVGTMSMRAGVDHLHQQIGHLVPIKRLGAPTVAVFRSAFREDVGYGCDATFDRGLAEVAEPEH